ncbi:MAG: type II secretion system F family protein [Gemmatimonadota bacterium]|nr:type II secretion system F family protein [Gemmatimonadota bacterium]
MIEQLLAQLPPNVLPAAAAFASVALAVLSIALLWEWWRDRRRQREIARRLSEMSDEGGSKGGGDPFADLFRDEETGEIAWLDPIVARFPHVRDLQILLDQAEVGWRSGTFLLVTVGAAVGFGLFAMVLFRIPIVGLGAASMGATLPYLWVKRRKKKRLERFEEHFPEAIDLLGRAIRAGHAFSTGLQMVSDESPEPIAGEFRRVFEEQKFGLPLEDSMLALADRIDLLDMRLFVTALLIQREVGGNLAEILDKISYTIRERFTIERQVRVYTAQGRFTGYLLAALPIAIGFLIYVLNPEYMSVLVTEPVGRLMIAVAAVLQVFGYLVIRRIIDVEV